MKPLPTLDKRILFFCVMALGSLLVDLVIYENDLHKADPLGPPPSTHDAFMSWGSDPTDYTFLSANHRAFWIDVPPLLPHTSWSTNLSVKGRMAGEGMGAWSQYPGEEIIPDALCTNNDIITLVFINKTKSMIDSKRRLYFLTPSFKNGDLP